MQFPTIQSVFYFLAVSILITGMKELRWSNRHTGFRSYWKSVIFAGCAVLAGYFIR